MEMKMKPNVVYLTPEQVDGEEYWDAGDFTTNESSEHAYIDKETYDELEEDTISLANACKEFIDDREEEVKELNRYIYIAYGLVATSFLSFFFFY